MANGPTEVFLAAVMALRTAYIDAKRRIDPAFDLESDAALQTVMQAIGEYREHLRTR